MAQYIKSTKSYNPFKDVTRTPVQKLEMVFTERQKLLMCRIDVTKSLIIACAKAVEFKQPIEVIVDKWVGQDTKKFLRILPLLITRCEVTC